MAFENNSKSFAQNFSSLKSNNQMESQVPAVHGSENEMQNNNSFTNSTSNDFRVDIFDKNNGLQSQWDGAGLGMIDNSNNSNKLNNNTEIVENSLEMPKFGLGKINSNYKIVGGINLI